MQTSRTKIGMSTKLGALSTSAIMLMAACGNGLTPESAPPVPTVLPGATEPQPAPESGLGRCEDVTGTVEFRWWGGDARQEMQLRALDRFRELYPGIQVNPQPVGFGGYWDQLQVEAVAGNTPDVFTSNEGWIASLVAGGMLADLTQQPTMDLSHFSADALGAAVGPGGAVYAIPTGGNAQAMFANLDILEAAGVPVPDDQTWTWEDFHNISQQVSEANITNASGAQIWGNAGLSAQGPARVWANQTDGGMFTPDGQLNWSQDSMEGLLALQADMVASGAAPSGTIQTEDGNASAQDTLMGQGQVAFWSQWSNLLPAVAAGSPDANFALLRFPGDHTSPHMGTWLNPSQFFAQSATAQSPEAAACLINFMVNNADAAEIMGIDRGVPFNPNMLAVVEPTLDERNAMVAEFMGRIAYDAAASTPLPELSEDLNHFTIASSDSVLFGLATPAAAAATMHSDLAAAIVQ